MGKRQFNNNDIDGKKKKKPKTEKTFVQNAQLNNLIKLVVEEENIDIAEAKICGLQVSPSIGDFIAGRCIRSGKQLKHFSGYDYIIEVSGELWDLLNEQTKYLLVYHELLHIGIKYKKDGSVVYGIVDHDIKDFRNIIKKYGIDWISEVNLLNSTLVDEGKQGEVKL